MEIQVFLHLLTGATSLATGGAVNISKTGVMTTVKGTLNSLEE